MRYPLSTAAATVAVALATVATFAVVQMQDDRDADGAAVHGASRPPATGEIGVADGRIDAWAPVSPFADHSAVTRLDPDLLRAVRSAAEDAKADGVVVEVTSGWRSARYQQELLDDAIAEQGAEEARRWVQTPTGSRHVSGTAVDIGPTDADS